MSQELPRPTVAARWDFSVNFLRLAAQRERNLSQRVAKSGNLLRQDPKEELPTPQVPEHEGPPTLLASVSVPFCKGMHGVSLQGPCAVTQDSPRRLRGQKPPDQQQHSKSSSCARVPPLPDLEAGKSAVLAHKLLPEHMRSQTSFGWLAEQGSRCRARAQLLCLPLRGGGFLRAEGEMAFRGRGPRGDRQDPPP